MNCMIEKYHLQIIKSRVQGYVIYINRNNRGPSTEPCFWAQLANLLQMKGLEFLMGPKEIPVFSLTLPAIILTAYPKVFIGISKAHLQYEPESIMTYSIRAFIRSRLPPKLDVYTLLCHRLLFTCIKDKKCVIP